MEQESFIKQIESYVGRGWVPIPVKYKSKTPIFDEWQKRTIKDVNIAADFKQPCNVGIVLGKNSGGVVDIDIDNKLALQIAAKLLSPTGMTFGHESNPDSHYVYNVEDCGETHKYQFPELGMIAEYRANGGHTVFPPSIHQFGEEIRFSSNGKPAEITRAELLKAVSKVAAATVAASKWKKGARHHIAMALSGILLGNGWKDDETEMFIAAICAATNDEETPDRLNSVHTTWQRIINKLPVTGYSHLSHFIGAEEAKYFCQCLGIKREQQIAVSAANTDVEVTAKEQIYSDTDNAERFARRVGNRAKFCHKMNKWLVYDGKRWKASDNGEIGRLAQKMAKATAHEAIETSGDKDIVRKAAGLLDEKRIRSMLKLAASICCIDKSELDADKYLFNCSNGTLDLRTGELLEHNPEHFITKLSPVVFYKDAKCPLWQGFLNRIFQGKQDVINYLKRIVGYSITGQINEQVLFIMHGSGANGKSTLINIVHALMGDYSTNANMETFMVNKPSSSASSDIARLDKIRFVSANEGERGQRFAEARVKGLVGGDKVLARFLFGEHFQFEPEFKLCIATNNLPQIKGNDVGIWRRINLIPFNVSIPLQEMDKELADKLKNELPGILNWAIEGCLEWQSDKSLNPPEGVKSAVQSYRAEMDITSQFLEDCCLIGTEHGVTTKKDLYETYSKWCEKNGEKAESKNAFGSIIKNYGLEETKSNGARSWKGLIITPEARAGMW